MVTRPTAPDDGGKDFADKLSAALAGYGTGPFIEFERKWYSGDEIIGYIERIAEAPTRAGLSAHEPVGVVVRNRVHHAAAVLGFIAARRPVAMIYSYQSAQSIARVIERLRLGAVVVDRDDWTAPVAAAVSRARSAAVVLSLQAPTVKLPASRKAVVPQATFPISFPTPGNEWCCWRSSRSPSGCGRSRPTG
jgi:acyl-CoA synthetase (AMP-forming)/AMP-acid ligase II